MSYGPTYRVLKAQQTNPTSNSNTPTTDAQSPPRASHVACTAPCPLPRLPRAASNPVAAPHPSSGRHVQHGAHHRPSPAGSPSTLPLSAIPTGFPWRRVRRYSPPPPSPLRTSSSPSMVGTARPSSTTLRTRSRLSAM
jgi:hypothetical protein